MAGVNSRADLLACEEGSSLQGPLQLSVHLAVHELYLTPPVRHLCRLLPRGGICGLSNLHRDNQAGFVQTEVWQAAKLEQLLLALLKASTSLVAVLLCGIKG